ncbi:hypothetical protein [Rhizobium sp. PEPV16]|uniref:hypothetical protein n=1 Tax=Rhizobium sp. PEPV16 TaxID=1820614 RepID=UPI001FEE051D|nr:hypothetical protein [Rhizobium sp. PEPV16]
MASKQRKRPENSNPGSVEGKQPLGHLAFQIEVAAFRQPANQAALLRLAQAQILTQLLLKLPTLAPIDGSCKSPICPASKIAQGLGQSDVVARAIAEYGAADNPEPGLRERRPIEFVWPAGTDAVQNLQEVGIDDRLEAGRRGMQPVRACQSMFMDRPKLGPPRGI